MPGLFGGKNRNAASDAAGAEIEASKLGVDELRRQFDVTQENVQPVVDAGTAQLSGLQAGATPQGLEATLAQIFSGEGFQSLRDERTRSIEGQLGARGLTRSGTAIERVANIPTELGFAIEQLLTGRSQSVAGQGQSAGINLGQIGAAISGGIADLLKGQGVSKGAGILGDAQAGAAGFGNILGFGAKVLSALPFSDPRLKVNAEKVSELGDLNIYQWDWIPETKGTVIADGPTIGFMADEVEQKYPEYVGEYATWKFIDYKGLLATLEQKFIVAPTHDLAMAVH